MKCPKIIVHCLVKNEENFIWYAINSVLPFVDKIMVWDTGSTDKTVEIIKTFHSPKIEFEKHSVTSREAMGSIRQDMLDKTGKDFDWLLILDGDEIWPRGSFQKVIAHISKNVRTQAVFVNTYNLVGDIYHKMSESGGRYKIKDKKGHLGLRFLNLNEISGLHADLPYGKEGYYAGDGTPVQSLPRVSYVNTYYFHATHLARSTKNTDVLDRSLKYKYSLGKIINKSEIPEVFSQKHPLKTINPHTKRTLLYVIIALVQDLYRKVSKRND